MGLFNELLGKMKLMPEDGEFDDEDMEDMDELEEETEAEDVLMDSEKKQTMFAARQAEPKTALNTSADPLSDDDRKKTNKVVSMKSTTSSTKNTSGKQHNDSSEVCMIMPKGYEDASEIADVLLRGKCVVLNLEGMNIEAAQRIIDFATGACYVMGGNLQKISKKIFIVTPSNVELTGDFTDLLGDSVNLSSLNLTM